MLIIQEKGALMEQINYLWTDRFLSFSLFFINKVHPNDRKIDLITGFFYFILDAAR
jgi:hypothetical protein